MIKSLTTFFILTVLCLTTAWGQPRCPWVWGAALEGYPITPEILAGQESASGLKPRLVVFFLQWPPPGAQGEFPRQSLASIREAGAVPCLTWEPMYHDQKGQEAAVSYQQILNGGYDPYLTSFAQAAREWGRPFIIRFAHEMNLARYHWGTTRQAYGPESPGLYRKMFRYLVELFRREGANNALWSFCPNAESQPHPRWDGAVWNRAAAYYPGNDYVDILGMDGYNWGTTQTREKHGWQSRWLSFTQIFDPLDKELKDLAPRKPLLVFETASAALGGQRSQWVREAVACLDRWEISAVTWFQVKKEVDWRLIRERDNKAIEPFRPGTLCGPDWLANLPSSQLKERR